MNIKGEIYRNDKTKMVYKVVEEVVNATNAQDGQRMILYSRHGEYFVREAKEFHEKFTRVMSETKVVGLKEVHFDEKMSDPFGNFTKDKEEISLAIANLLNDFIMKYPVARIEVETNSKKNLQGRVLITGLEIKVEL